MVFASILTPCLRRLSVALYVFANVLAFVPDASAQTRWCGTPLSFIQPSAGQPDILTPAVSLNRGQLEGLFNSVQESSFAFGSPAGTEWAFGTSADYPTLIFQPWLDTIDSQPLTQIGQPMVVHLLQEDIYVDLEFAAWAIGPGVGSRFSYVRSTPGACDPPSVSGLAGGGWVVLCVLMLALAGVVLPAVGPPANGPSPASAVTALPIARARTALPLWSPARLLRPSHARSRGSRGGRNGGALIRVLRGRR